MSRSVVLTFGAIVAVIYGLGLVLIPTVMNEAHGLANNPGASLLARCFGSALLGIGVMAWLARNAAESDALLALMRGALVYAVISLIVVGYAVLTGVVNATGWVAVIVDALLIVGLGYYGALRTGR